MFVAYFSINDYFIDFKINDMYLISYYKLANSGQSLIYCFKLHIVVKKFVTQI